MFFLFIKRFSLTLLIVYFLSFPCLKIYGQASTLVNWSTWDEWQSGSGTDPSANTLLLYGLDATGTSPTALHADDGPNTTYDGDLIELGFFKLADGTASNTAFKGVWTPLTTKTTIGQNTRIFNGSGSDAYTIPAGEFSFETSFSDNGGGQDADYAISNPYGIANQEKISTDTQTALSDHLTLLDNSVDAGASALIGLRFYDINTGGDGSTTKATNGSTRYNTVMDAAWAWQKRGSGTPVSILLHEQGGGDDTSVQFEFDNTSYGDNGSYTAKVGTGNNSVSDAAANSLNDDDYVATVTYFSDLASAVTLDLDDDDGIGSTIISGFDGTNTSSKLTGGDDGTFLTIHSATGNTGNDAFEFAGDIFETSSSSSDLSITKTGGGDQKLTGNINLASASGDKGYINLLEGGLTLNPGSGETQVIEYLKGASGTTLTLDSTGAGTIELGFAQSQSGATFSGNVALMGTGSSNTIKVATGTTTADYAKEQVFGTGVISGSEKLSKSGVGRLKLTGDNTFSGGMDINDGTVVAGHADALGGSGNTVTINKGKLEVSSGITLANNTIQGGSGKSIIGGDGTVGTIIIGGDANEIDYLSPGQGISSSLTPSLKQVGLGNGSANDAIGSFTATNLSLLGGGVYDWEMQDFDGTTGGTDYDVMNFTNLTFGSSSDRFTINIMGIQSSDGTAGAPDNLVSIWNKSRQGAGSGSTNGFKFLAGNSGTINWGGWATDGSNINDYFDIRYDDLAWNTSNNGQYNQWGQDWDVIYSGGDFYLQFSAAPEPSTYIMVTGLFMLPGYRFIRRIRKKGKSTSEEIVEV
jgi:autotransporter-associated beta strand protein